MTWLLLARHSPAGTPIIAAPASINVMRPAAPARLIASKFMRTLHEPPVISAPSTGSLYLGSLSTSWMFIMRQSASSSSATICAMAEDTCWPISALPTITVTLPSGAIEYHAVGSNLPAASASLMPCTPETAT